MKKKIVFATSNPHKLEELKAICEDKCNVEFILPPAGFDPVEDGVTFEANSLKKAREAARISDMPALADDSGLCVEALDGGPGIHSARYAETAQKRIDKLLAEMKYNTNRRAKFVCVMTLVDKQGKVLCQARGECHGQIAYVQSGINGFGYDPIFIVNGTDKTMADLSEEDKNKISHRARALEQMIEFLKEFAG